MKYPQMRLLGHPKRSLKILILKGRPAAPVFKRRKPKVSYDQQIATWLKMIDEIRVELLACCPTQTKKRDEITARLIAATEKRVALTIKRMHQWG